MAVLDTAIQDDVLRAAALAALDGRIKSGHDELVGEARPKRTPSYAGLTRVSFWRRFAFMKGGWVYIMAHRRPAFSASSRMIRPTTKGTPPITATV